MGQSCLSDFHKAWRIHIDQSKNTLVGVERAIVCGRQQAIAYSQPRVEQTRADTGSELPSLLHLRKAVGHVEKCITKHWETNGNAHSVTCAREPMGGIGKGVEGEGALARGCRPAHAGDTLQLQLPQCGTAAAS